MAESPRPGFLRRFSSKQKPVTEQTLPNRSRSTSLGSATPESKLSGGRVLATLSELRHGANSTSSQPSRTEAVKDAVKDVGKGDKIVKPPDLLDLPENPVSRWSLHARAVALRQLANVGFNLQNRADPPAPTPTRIRWIDSTLSTWSGKRKIPLDIWQPSDPPKQERGRACVIVFHGGGFVLGNGTDDSRWAGAVMDHLDAAVVAVNYRVAPGYPFPTPTEDCADGILHIANNASEYAIDPDKIFLSGFSAGGNLALSAYYLITSPEIWKYDLKQDVPKIRGIITFYPLLDFTISRKDKKAACSRPEFCLPDSMTGLFDQSYLHPPPDRSDVRISPGLAPEEILKDLPPIHLCCCEWDMLLNEGKAFRDRLRGMGKEVVWREVKEEKHAWDKPPPLAPKKSVLEEYVKAIESMKSWLGGQVEETIQSAVRTKVGDGGEIVLENKTRTWNATKR